MSKALLTPFVIAGLLLLASCSDSGVEKAIVCQTAKDDSRYYSDGYETNKELYRDQTYKNLVETGFIENYQSKEFLKEMNENFYNSQLIIVNNQSCFLPSEVTEAQGHVKRLKYKYE